MQHQERDLNSANISRITQDFLGTLSEIGESIHGLRGIALLTALKRDKLAHGPYKNVTLFEAANRIMSDLVILRGVAALLQANAFAITQYRVEFGNEDNNGFDIRGTAPDGKLLIGEAFNVAPSFFQVKKLKALTKMRQKGGDATFRLLLVNDDAVRIQYRPKPAAGVHYAFVNVESGELQITPGLGLAPG